ncbi:MULTISPECIES: transposase [Akkermansia]|uniref:transposase n=1 Tax=Akkermansia TaxID=239934 RepID=UPI003313073C
MMTIKSRKLLAGIVEVDETYIDDREDSKHSSKKLNTGRDAVGKTAVFVMRERGGKFYSPRQTEFQLICL